MGGASRGEEKRESVRVCGECLHCMVERGGGPKGARAASLQKQQQGERWHVVRAARRLKPPSGAASQQGTGGELAARQTPGIRGHGVEGSKRRPGRRGSRAGVREQSRRAPRAVLRLRLGAAAGRRGAYLLPIHASSSSSSSSSFAFFDSGASSAGALRLRCLGAPLAYVSTAGGGVGGKGRGRQGSRQAVHGGRPDACTT